MIAIEEASPLVQLSTIRMRRQLARKCLVPMPAEPPDWDVSPLTGAFLEDLSEVSLVQFGEDPLGAFDTKVALLTAHPFACEVDLDDEVILVSDSFLGALEFASAQAALVNLIRKLETFLVKTGESGNPLLHGIRQSKQAIHSMYMARMLLHIIGERPAPSIASVLPREYKRFVHAQLATAATFALLHEQAHLAIKVGQLKPEISVDLTAAFVGFTPSPDQIEEYACDRWAAQRVGEESRGKFVRSACFFFFNQWVVDYLLHNETSVHPPTFNRIQHLMLALPEMRGEDMPFFDLMTDGLNSQQQLRQALNIKDQTQRYAQMLKFARAGGQFEHYEAIADALSRSFEQLGLAQSRY